MARRFFVPGELLEADGWTLLPGEVVRHAVRVLRLGSGTQVHLCATDGSHACARISERDGTWGFELEGPVLRDDEADARCVWLVPAMFKAQRFDWMLEKAAELGANAIAPFHAARSVVYWKDDKVQRKLERCDRILTEATRQSGGYRPPDFLPPTSLPERLDELQGSGLHVLWADPTAQRPIDTVMAALPGRGGVALVTGPEGGFTREELDLLASQGEAVCLGSRVLRAETAPVAMLSTIRLLSL